MAVYTLHVPAGSVPGDPAALDEAVLVRDGFSWGAFIFQVLWCLYRRLWIAAVVLLVLTVGADLLMNWAGLPAWAVASVSLVIVILFALEANDLRRRKLERQGMMLAGVVVASNKIEAEARAFALWLAGRTSGAGMPGPNQAGPAQPPPKRPEGPRGSEPRRGSQASGSQASGSSVLGLFPEPEGAR
jgi:hypothetical protein